METRPHPDIPVTTDAELAQRWGDLLHLDGPPSQRRLYLTWLRRDGTMVHVLIPTEELPAEPHREVIGAIADLHAVVVEAEGEGLHLAMCLERPGPRTPTPDDAAWCAAIESIVRGRDGLDCSLHLVDRGTAVPLLPRRRWPTS